MCVVMRKGVRVRVCQGVGVRVCQGVGVCTQPELRVDRDDKT